MYLIALQKGGYQAIPIRNGDKWDFRKLLVGRREVRIIMRVHGRHYLLYHTRDLTQKHPGLRREHLIHLCDEIIAITTERISNGQKYIEFNKITGAAEYRHQRHWREQGLITPTTPSAYHDYPIDPKTDQLVSCVRVDHDDIIVMDHELLADCEEEELPY